jgi:hypothetical protein
MSENVVIATTDETADKKHRFTRKHIAYATAAVVTAAGVAAVIYRAKNGQLDVDTLTEVAETVTA